MSNFLCSLTRNITPHSMENLAVYSLLRWQMIILPILTVPLCKMLGECTLVLNLEVEVLMVILSADFLLEHPRDFFSIRFNPFQCHHQLVHSFKLSWFSNGQSTTRRLLSAVQTTSQNRKMVCCPPSQSVCMVFSVDLELPVKATLITIAPWF